MEEEKKAQRWERGAGKALHRWGNAAAGEGRQLESDYLLRSEYAHAHTHVYIHVVHIHTRTHTPAHALCLPL